MIIRGILDSSLNGQICIRGFAPIKELARISEADYKYQRNPIEDRKDISDFLEHETYLFFPEVILSYKIKHSFDKSKDSETPLQKLQSSKSYKSNVDGTVFKPKPVDFKAREDVRGNSKINLIEIEIDDSQFDLVKKPFHRIDGNHRLDAAGLSESPKVQRMVAPFCIILGEEYYKGGNPVKNSTTDVFDKSVKVFFHNINTKTIALTSEENLRVIIDDSTNFLESELEDILNLEGVLTRTLIKKVNPEIFTGIENILSKQYRTYYIEVFHKLLAKGENPESIVDKVFESLKAIDTLYNENEKLKANSSFGLLTSFLYYHVEENKGKFNLFKKWVIQNHIFEIPEITASSIIKIFDKIAEQEITVFVAMPYFGHDSSIIRGYNEAYERVIEKLKQENPSLKISLFPIMEHIGRTMDIVFNFLNQIKECKIFIADISEKNPNVAYELGFARSLDKPSIIVIKDGEEIPFDYGHDIANKYNGNGPLNDLEGIIYDNIKSILLKDYGLVIS
ncbi:hypothetical protein [Sediminicola arcticus]|uniref:DGQHR domain-containing protein n=1 Tax=Sediminicola arcticus TaxID=1574308 RepID=A0ABV2SWD6_9FLAO